MKFLTDILAKAGLTVDGVVTLNNTATGQTPAANDNSTKLATTAWVQSYVVPYSLPIASASVLGGVKVGSGLSIDAGTGVLSASGAGNLASFRTKQVFTATAGQTTFTVSGGYTPGFIDVFVNGVYINDDLYTATNSSTIVLDDAASLNDLVTVFVYSPYYVGQSPSSRDICIFTATAGQTTFSCSYVIGAVDVFYNGAKLAGSEFNASNGTTVVLNTACNAGDYVEVISWVAGGGLSSSRTITIDGVTQDLTANRTWNILPTGGATGDILAKTSATNYAVAWIPNYTSQVQHYVKLGEAMTVGTAVYVSSSTGNAGTNMIVSKASNASEALSSKTMGLLASGGAQNDIVFVVTEGLVAGIDTSTANAGDPVWLGVNGQLIFGLANKPYAPAHLVFIGIVTRAQQNNGEIFVKVQNGFELQELHNVQITATPADNTVLSYESSSSLYKMKSIATLLGYTPADDSLVVHKAGSEAITGVKTFNAQPVFNSGISIPNGNSIIFNGTSTLISGNASANELVFTTGNSLRVTINNSGLTLNTLSAATTDTDRFLVSDSGVIKYRTGTEILSDIGAQAALSGTGFVKISGTTISYDNSTYALDNAVVHLAGTETITGDKTITGSLTITSTTKAFIPPRMTDAQRGAISSPTVGSIVYQTDGTEGIYVYTASGWKSLVMT